MYKIKAIEMAKKLEPRRCDNTFNLGFLFHRSFVLAPENKDGILASGCFHKPMNLGVNESTIWGDYYFIEALMNENFTYSNRH